MKTLKGAVTALVTPFKKGEVDEELYAKLIKRQIDAGVAMVSPMGTTGESPTVSHDEHKRCIEIAVDVCKGSGVKVLAGAGSNATKEAVDLARFAEKAGADALLVVAPYYNKPTQQGLYEHYKTIAGSVDIGVMLYNVPGRCGVDIRAETAVKLFDTCPNVFAIKEASGSMERCVEINAKRPDFYIFCGEDAINYNILANGGVGIVSVTANLLPHLMVKLVNDSLSGDFKSAKAINDQLFEINKTLFLEVNPIPIKAAMYAAGILPHLEYRLPLTPPSAEVMIALENMVKKYEHLLQS